MANRKQRRAAQASSRRKIVATGDRARMFRIEGGEIMHGATPAVAEVEAAVGDGGPSRFTMLAYRGGELRLTGWPDPVVVDLEGVEGLDRAFPVLKDHSPSLIVGHATRAEVAGSEIHVEGVVSGAGVVASEFEASARSGFPWQSSIGARALVYEDVAAGVEVTANGRTFRGPLHIVRRSQMREISVVAIGADDGSNTRLAASAAGGEGDFDMKFRQWLEASGFNPDDLSEKQELALRAAFDAEQAGGGGDEGDAGDEHKDGGQAPKEGGRTVAASGQAVGMAPASGGSDDAVTESRRLLAAEKSRQAQIAEICAGDLKIEAKAIEEGWSAERTELEVLRASRAEVPAAHVSGARRSGAPAPDKVLEAALCLSHGLDADKLAASYGKKVVDAAMSREMQGVGLQFVVYDTLRAAGLPFTPGVMNDRVIADALRADGQIQAASGFSTVGLTGILGNVANKAMEDGYAAIESVVEQFAGTKSVSDFKQHTGYRLTADGKLEKVGATGELKHGTMSEESYTYQIDTWGRMFSLNRQMIINDDLGAFLELPSQMGRLAAITRERAVFELWLSNPSSFFSAGNANYFDGASSALSVTSLSTAEQKFMDQTDANGDPILMSPSRLLVPTSLKVTANQLFQSTRLNHGSADDAPENNPHAGRYSPIVSPYLNAQALTGSSVTAWYLVGNPASNAPIVISYLNGRRAPTLESADSDFNVLGRQWRIYWDFGVDMRDHRAAVMSKGSA